AVQVEVAETATDGGILDHHDPPALPVAAARSEPGGVEHPGQDVVRHRLVGELAHGPRGAQRLDQVHRRTVPATGGCLPEMTWRTRLELVACSAPEKGGGPKHD